MTIALPPFAKVSAICPIFTPTAANAPSQNACETSEVHSEFVHPSASVEFSRAFKPSDAPAVIANTASEPPPVNGAAIIAPIITPILRTVFPVSIVEI